MLVAFLLLAAADLFVIAFFMGASFNRKVQ